jgi:hypothetical protein
MRKRRICLELLRARWLLIPVLVRLEPLKASRLLLKRRTLIHVLIEPTELDQCFWELMAHGSLLWILMKR